MRILVPSTSSSVKSGQAASTRVFPSGGVGVSGSVVGQRGGGLSGGLERLEGVVSSSERGCVGLVYDVWFRVNDHAQARSEHIGWGPQPVEPHSPPVLSTHSPSSL